jgi:S1-C subfamily serine protease
VSFDTGLQPAANSRPQVAIGQVFPGSPADHAGLQQGDVVTRVGELPINSFDTIQLAVSVQPPSSVIKIQYERGGRSETAEVELAKLAVAGKTIATVRPDSWHGIRVDYATALDAAALMTAIENKAYDPAGCVLVTVVEPDSAAWKKGVRAGMFISHVGGRRVTTPEVFRAIVRQLGDRFDVQLTQPIPPGEQTEPDRRKSNGPASR